MAGQFREEPTVVSQTPYLIEKLKEQLQTTLDLKNVLQLFYTTLRTAFPMIGLSFQNLDHTISLSFGDITQEYIGKQLILDKHLLGSIRFFPETLDSSLLDQASVCLLYPLRNTLQYHVALLRASRDPVTGLGNRYALETCLNQLKTAAVPLALILIDIDNFKRLNDLYGHIAGDHALLHIAVLLKQRSLLTHPTFRYGGDEYLILLPNVSKMHAIQLAEQLQHAIQHHPFHIEGIEEPLTVSMGIAYHESSAESFQTLFEQADKALYLAKKSGKNCIKDGSVT